MLAESNYMSDTAFYSRVEKYFGYLCDEYAFSVATKETFDHFDVCETTMHSNQWCIRIGRERGSVYVYAGPSLLSDTWFSLGTVITFLEKDSEIGQRVWFGPKPDWSLSHYARLDAQLKWYADMLRPYPPRIAGLLRPDAFDGIQAELNGWKQRKDKQAREALARGDLPK